MITMNSLMISGKNKASLWNMKFTEKLYL